MEFPGRLWEKGNEDWYKENSLGDVMMDEDSAAKATDSLGQKALKRKREPKGEEGRSLRWGRNKKRKVEKSEEQKERPAQTVYNSTLGGPVLQKPTPITQIIAEVEQKRVGLKKLTNDRSSFVHGQTIYKVMKDGVIGGKEEAVMIFEPPIMGGSREILLYDPSKSQRTHSCIEIAEKALKDWKEFVRSYPKEDTLDKPFQIIADVVARQFFPKEWAERLFPQENGVEGNRGKTYAYYDASTPEAIYESLMEKWRKNYPEEKFPQYYTPTNKGGYPCIPLDWWLETSNRGWDRHASLLLFVAINRLKSSLPKGEVYWIRKSVDLEARSFVVYLIRNEKKELQKALWIRPQVFQEPDPNTGLDRAVGVSSDRLLDYSTPMGLLEAFMLLGGSEQDLLSLPGTKEILESFSKEEVEEKEEETAEKKEVKARLEALIKKVAT